MTALSRRPRRPEDEQPVLFPLPETVRKAGRNEHPAFHWHEVEGTNAELLAYMDGLRQSNCVGCGRVQYTPRGEPMNCPKCTSGEEAISKPSVPMQMKGRRGKKR